MQEEGSLGMRGFPQSTWEREGGVRKKRGLKGGGREVEREWFTN